MQVLQRARLHLGTRPASAPVVPQPEHHPPLLICKQCMALMLIMVNIVIQLLPFVTCSSETSSCYTLIVPVSNKTSGGDDKEPVG